MWPPPLVQPQRIITRRLASISLRTWLKVREPDVTVPGLSTSPWRSARDTFDPKVPVTFPHSELFLPHFTSWHWEGGDVSPVSARTMVRDAAAQHQFERSWM